MELDLNVTRVVRPDEERELLARARLFEPIIGVWKPVDDVLVEHPFRYWSHCATCASNRPWRV